MTPDQPIHPVYLPFTLEQLRQHVPPVPTRPHLQEESFLRYYTGSRDRYVRFLREHPDRAGIPLSDARKPCQIEKDERFWVVACLMAFFHHPDRQNLLARLLGSCFGETPPLQDVTSWGAALDGELHLWFEVNLPSPLSYKKLLGEELEQRHPIPYVRHAAHRRDGVTVRSGLEGPTHADALLLNASNGFAVLFEAKVLSDVSYQISFDARRNQIARNVDVLLDPNPEMPDPLDMRRPDRSLFVLLTPEMFRDRPETRLYGWLMREYQANAQALERDLPHRDPQSLEGWPKRIAWLTWEDAARVLPSSCRWLPGR